MYGLPADLDLSLFVGRVLESILFSENSVQFDLGPDIMITLESSYSLVIKVPRSHSEQSVVPPFMTALPSLVGKCIKSAKAMTNGGLRLEFETGATLDLCDDSDKYESFRIRVASREFIV